MEDRPQKKVSPIWYSAIPSMLGWLPPLVLILWVFLLTMMTMFWHLFQYHNSHIVLAIYRIAVITGLVGIVLLFFARLPLYRQHRFFVFGSRHLDIVHRRLYRLAYGFVFLSGFLLLALLLSTPPR